MKQVSFSGVLTPCTPQICIGQVCCACHLVELSDRSDLSELSCLSNRCDLSEQVNLTCLSCLSCLTCLNHLNCLTRFVSCVTLPDLDPARGGRDPRPSLHVLVPGKFTAGEEVQEQVQTQRCHGNQGCHANHIKYGDEDDGTRDRGESCYHTHCDPVEELVEESEVGATPHEALLQGPETRGVEASHVASQSVQWVPVGTENAAQQTTDELGEGGEEEDQEEAEAEEGEEEEGEEGEQDQGREGDTRSAEGAAVPAGGRCPGLRQPQLGGRDGASGGGGVGGKRPAAGGGEGRGGVGERAVSSRVLGAAGSGE